MSFTSYDTDSETMAIYCLRCLPSFILIQYKDSLINFDSTRLLKGICVSSCDAILYDGTYRNLVYACVYA